MRFEVLGPLRVVAEGAHGSTLASAGRLRVVLAVLLSRADRPVSVDELCELVWDGAPSAGAPAALRGLVLRLRRVMGPQAGARIATRAPGYVIELRDGELDAARFETLCRSAGTAVRAGRWAEAATAASRALELWRGTPLEDVPCQALRDTWRPHLEELRVQALEWRVEADLRLGRHDQVACELRDLTDRHPLRERFHAQLMLALAGAGRQAEALAAYRNARRVLVDQLGVEPGPELRDLHRRILAGAAGLLTTPKPESVAPAPRQLPAGARYFVGRERELEVLRELSAQRFDAVGAVVISAIDGMAGIGKTALAVHAAHRLADRFPDGQLFVDLHGYTQGYAPRSAGEALEAFLRALGVPVQRIPEEIEQRATLYRQRLAETRTLIVLDNAADEAQVRPLLPGAAGCLVLVTSRRRLKGLDDAHVLSLDLLPHPEALGLLRAVAGPDRVPVGDPLLDEVARLCGRLPLALRIAGALLRHRPAWSLEHLAALLRDQRRRVSALADGERDLGAVFDLSYTALDRPRRRLFRLLGLVPGPDVDAYAAAALLDRDPATATGLLENLVDQNLLIAHAPGRYRLHDLLRAHARTLAAEDAEADRGDAVDRLLHYYAHTAQSASIPIARYPCPEPAGPAPTHAPVLPDAEAARAWLRAERDNLEAAHTHARTYTRDEHTVALAAGLAEILRTDGPFTRAVDLHRAAVDAAHRLGPPVASATALTDLGISCRQSGDLPTARETFARALGIYRATGDRNGEATVLTELGRVRLQTGDMAGARDAQTQARDIYRAIGNPRGEAYALAELGAVRHLTGDSPGARDALARALEIHRAMGDRHGAAIALTDLGRVQTHIGDLIGAGEALAQALEIYRATGIRHGEAVALTDLGTVRRLDGDLPGARDALTQALEICRAIGHPQGEAYALTDLGRVWQSAGDPAAAAEAFAQALEIYRAAGDRSNEAWALNHYAAAVAAGGDLPRALELFRRALDMNREMKKPDDEGASLEGVGECLVSAGRVEDGLGHLRQALEIYRRLGMAPDAERVGTRLARRGACQGPEA